MKIKFNSNFDIEDNGDIVIVPVAAGIIALGILLFTFPLVAVSIMVLIWLISVAVRIFRIEK